MVMFGANSILAAGGIDLQIPTSLDTPARSALGGMMPVLVAIFLIVAALVVWAVFIRKSPRRRERGRLVASKAKAREEKDQDEDDDEGDGSHRRRRRRRSRSRHRNPTLADTGGLPPLGAGDPKSPPL